MVILGYQGRQASQVSLGLQEIKVHKVFQELKVTLVLQVLLEHQDQLDQ